MREALEQAIVCHRAGDIAEATELYRAVLREQPEQPDALHMLGLIAQQQGNPTLALKLIEAALAKKQDLALAWQNRALVLRVLERPEEALQSAWQAIDLDPQLADAWGIAGSLLGGMTKYDEACLALKRAVDLQPQNARYLTNYAALLLSLGQLQEAYKVGCVAYKLEPAFASITLGHILKAAGYPEKAALLFKMAYEIMPHIHETRVNEAMAWLQIGDMERGWPLWETRPDSRRQVDSPPLWRGENIKHLLLYEDQGIGDALQCVRYLPLLRGRVEKITLQLTKSLQNLLVGQFPGVSVISLDDPVPEVDASAQLMSLPNLCQTTRDTIPASVPYLHVQQEWCAPWHERLKQLTKPRIGLVWGGNQNHRNDRNRSLAFSALAPLLQVGQAHWVSLQKGREKEQAADLFDAAPFLDDFTATAGLIEELDLLITVDTSPVHLAGALGKPVWMLTPFDPDWRWFLGREDSPWYPTLRLFRQNRPGDWDGVITRVAENLQRFLHGEMSVLKPSPWTGTPLRENPYAVDMGMS